VRRKNLDPGDRERYKGPGGAVAISLETLAGGRTSIDDATLDELRTRIRGDVLKPGDPGYAERPVFNAMHAYRPALIVRCAGTADVADAVKFARKYGLLAAVRGGGHSVAGHSSCDGGMIIDLTRMRGVDLDAGTRVVRVQGGAVWGDVDRETQAFGLVVPGGVVSEIFNGLGDSFTTSQTPCTMWNRA